jgi:hypothetical protein
MFELSFTGTQKGMTDAQFYSIQGLVRKCHSKHGKTRAHHGDCIGADEEFDVICRAQGFWMVGHPPTNSSKRAFCKFDEIRKPLPYLERNKAIVNEGNFLIAAPETPEEVLRSGTWSTIRYARKVGRKYVIVLPDGSFTI